jgi:hypothetical protein
MNKTAFVISIALTTFVLMAVGGIAYAVRAAGQAEAAGSLPTTIPAAVIDPVATIDAAALQALNDRETTYQQMIAEANARLEQAQQKQQALESQLATLQAQANNQTTAAQETAITPEDAASIASNYWGLTSVYSVEVVTVQGENFYQVTFSSGDLVFVDMQGKVAGAITATQLASLNPQPGKNQPASSEHESEGDND